MSFRKSLHRAREQKSQAEKQLSDSLEQLTAEENERIIKTRAFLVSEIRPILEEVNHALASEKGEIETRNTEILLTWGSKEEHRYGVTHFSYQRIMFNIPVRNWSLFLRIRRHRNLMSTSLIGNRKSLISLLTLM
jgi:thymidylate synthase ThyX